MSLSEMIAAFGDDFDALTCCAPYGWNASYFQGSHNRATRASVSGATPEDAVADALSAYQAKAWLTA